MTVFLIKNTSDDRQKVAQHRIASGFYPEPMIGGARLRVKEWMYLSIEHFERIRERLYKSFTDGVITAEQVNVPDDTDIRYGVPFTPDPQPTKWANPVQEPAQLGEPIIEPVLPPVLPEPLVPEIPEIPPEEQDPEEQPVIPEVPTQSHKKPELA